MSEPSSSTIRININDRQFAGIKQVLALNSFASRIDCLHNLQFSKSINMSTKLVRMDILVSPAIKREIKQQAAQAKQPANRYGGKLVAKKVRSFAEAANISLQQSIQSEALLGFQQAILRKKQSTTRR